MAKRRKPDSRSGWAAIFERELREDLAYWVSTDRKTALRILALVEDVLGGPFDGLGKPEPLRHWTEGAWSRRIIGEHRLVYLVEERRVHFLQARYHY